MSNDLILNLKLNGPANLDNLKRVKKEIDDTAERSRKVKQQIDSWGARMAANARAERKAAFDRLSTEEKILRINRERERLEGRLAIAEMRGNERRIAAFRLRLQELKAMKMSDITSGAAPAVGGGGGFAGALGGSLLARMGISGLGAAGLVSGIGVAVGGAVRLAMGSLRRADESSDFAGMFGMTRADAIRVRHAAGMAGVPERAVGDMMSRLMQAQQEAGDTGSLLGYGSKLAGSGKSLDELSKIVGGRPERFLALFGEIAGMSESMTSQLEQSTAVLDRSNTKLEKAWFQIRSAWDSFTSLFISGFPFAPGTSARGIRDSFGIGGGDRPRGASGSWGDDSNPEAAGFFSSTIDRFPRTDAMSRIGLFRHTPTEPTPYASTVMLNQTAAITRREQKADRVIQVTESILREIGILNSKVESE